MSATISRAKRSRSGPRMMRVKGELESPMTVSTITEGDGDVIRVVPGRHPKAIAVVTEVPDECGGLSESARMATASALGLPYDAVGVVGLDGTTDYEAEGMSVSLAEQVAAFVNGWRTASGTDANPPAADIARGTGFSEAVVEHVLKEMTARGW